MKNLPWSGRQVRQGQVLAAGRSRLGSSGGAENAPPAVLAAMRTGRALEQQRARGDGLNEVQSTSLLGNICGRLPNAGQLGVDGEAVGTVISRRASRSTTGRGMAVSTGQHAGGRRGPGDRSRGADSRVVGATWSFAWKSSRARSRTPRG